MKKTQDLSGSFFDLQDARLTKLKDPLAQLGEVVDWEAFRPLLSRIRPAPRHVPVHSLEIEKTVVDVEAPRAGILKRTGLAGETYPVGEVIGEIVAA